MQFTLKFTSILAVAASAFTVAQAAVVDRSTLAEISVVFFDDINLTGASFAASGLVPGVCNTLPGNWLDRPESVQIGPSFGCTLYSFAQCEGPGTFLTGTVNILPMPSLYDNTESFVCNKQI